MAQATPEPSEQRQFAARAGYGVTILLAAVLLILSAPDAVGDVAPLIPPVAGAIVYLIFKYK